MANDDRRAQAHSSHGRSDIASVLSHAIGPLWFIGIAPASQIWCKHRTLASQAFGDPNEVQMRSGQSVQGNDRRTTAWPITESEFHAIP